MIQKI